jgi:hypothetical protein
MNKYGMIFGVVMFAAGFFTHSALSPSVDAHAAIAPSTDKPIPAQAARPDNPDPETLALKKQIAQLESQIALRTQRTATPPATLPTALEREVDTDSSQPKAADAELDKMQEQMVMEAKERAQAMRRWHEEASKKPGGMAAVMDEKFNQENVDDNWAASQETKLYDKFSTDAQLAELSVTETQCRTTWCRVSIVTSDALPDYSKMAQLVNDTGANAGFSSFMTIPEPEAGLFHIYFNNEPLTFHNVTDK